MSQRPRAWAHFARLLPPDLRGEEVVLQWLADEEIDRVLAALEAWNEITIAEGEAYWQGLGGDRRWFRRDGTMTGPGYDRYDSYTPPGGRSLSQEQERMDEVASQPRFFYGGPRWVRRIIQYARDRVAGTATVEDADRFYKESTQPWGPGRLGRPVNP